MSLYRGYAAAGRTCAGKAQPGAVALMSYSLGAYPKARNDGIYNCRTMRGSTLPSVHGEGRALDVGCTKGAAWAQKYADRLIAHSAQLGVQCVIYAGRIWSGAHPDAGWRAYHGVDQHFTHLHVELSRKAAQNLTVARVVSVLTPEAAVALTDSDVDRIADAVMHRLANQPIVPNPGIRKDDPDGKPFTVVAALANVETNQDSDRERFLKPIRDAVRPQT